MPNLKTTKRKHESVGSFYNSDDDDDDVFQEGGPTVSKVSKHVTISDSSSPIQSSSTESWSLHGTAIKHLGPENAKKVDPETDRFEQQPEVFHDQWTIAAQCSKRTT